jgi:hypothetical protein
MLRGASQQAACSVGHGSVFERGGAPNAFRGVGESGAIVACFLLIYGQNVFILHAFSFFSFWSLILCNK